MIFQQEIGEMAPQFFIYYNMHMIDLSAWHLFAINSGYFLWKMCAFSHILVSIMAGFLIVSITVCLRSGNEYLLGLFSGDNHLLLLKKRKKIKFIEQIKDDGLQEKKYMDGLNRFKDIQVLAENVVGSISQIFGVSLIIEVLILISNLLVAFFYILVPFTGYPSNSMQNGQQIIPPSNNESLAVFQSIFKNYLKKEEGSEVFQLPDDMDNHPQGQGFSIGHIFSLLGEAFIHSYFFYKLCCKANEMVTEVIMQS